MLKYQYNNLNQLNRNLNDKKELVIVGPPNSGRKFVVEKWKESIGKSIIINLETPKTNRSYASLLYALNKLDVRNTKTLKLTPSIPGNPIDITIEEESLFELEEKINKTLKKILKKHVIIFLIDSSLYNEDDSYEFVESFKKNYKKKNKIYKIIISDKTIKDLSCIYFESISNSSEDKLDILKNLGLDPEISVSEKVVEFIFANISNNIKLLINIVNDFNTNKLDSEFENHDINNQLNKLINGTLQTYKYKEQINDLLTICAIANNYFSSIDLAYILDENEAIIKILLEFAQKHYLLENNDFKYKIIFSLVKKIYSNLDEISKNKIYISILNMYSNIYPSDYYNKYFFANLANHQDKKIYLMQYIFSKIRMNHDIAISDYENQLDSKEYNIVKIYNQAFGYINNKKYGESVSTLNTLIDLSGAVLYEINILKSQCLIKNIDETDRQLALNYLEYDANYVDENLMFRLDIRKIAAYIHVGKYKKAFNTCENVKNRLLRMCEKTKALEYEYYVNVIYRKYSYICVYDISINYIQKSVEFFRKYKKIYFKAYYISLTNLFSLYIVNMQLNKACEIKQEIEELMLSKNNINFSRQEILANNIILYNYFSKEINLKDTIYEFNKLYNDTLNMADNILIASNYAVFLMLSNNYEQAKKILLNECKNVDNDLEGIYNYRIVINLSICEFLMENKNRDNCIQRLKTIKYNKEDPHYKVRNNELNNIINLMSNIESCNDAEKWCNEFKNNISKALNSYTTYEQGMIFTTLFNWDDD